MATKFSIFDALRNDLSDNDLSDNDLSDNDLSDLSNDISSSITGGAKCMASPVMPLDDPNIIGGASAVSEKDDVIQDLIPDKVPECLDGENGTCFSTKFVFSIASALDIPDDTPAEIIEKAKSHTGCESQTCVVDAVSGKLPHHEIETELRSSMPIEGPTDKALLSNVPIDSMMRAYEHKFPGFFAYNFNMRNYFDYSFRSGRVVEHPDTLATIQVKDLLSGAYNQQEYKCCGCIINQDVYQGGGTHWMALFADWRTDSPTVEFFNSSGNGPRPEWVSWLVKTKNQLRKLYPAARIINVSSIKHQKSRTECGVYSLYYIYARLRGISHEYFNRAMIPDKLMFEFRQVLFKNKRAINGGKFDWDQFTKEISIDWE